MSPFFDLSDRQGRLATITLLNLPSSTRTCPSPLPSGPSSPFLLPQAHRPPLLRNGDLQPPLTAPLALPSSPPAAALSRAASSRREKQALARGVEEAGKSTLGMTSPGSALSVGVDALVRGVARDVEATQGASPMVGATSLLQTVQAVLQGTSPTSSSGTRNATLRARLDAIFRFFS